MKIKQLSVFVENKTGRINEVAQILGRHGVNMTAFSLADSADFGILRMIVSDVKQAEQVLREAHFGVSVTEVVCLSCSNVPGSLSNILDCLAKEQVFIEYMYAFSEGETARVVIRPTDLDRCIDILSRCSCHLMSRNTLDQM